MATRVKQGVSSEKWDANGVHRDHRGNDVTVEAGSVVLKSDSGHSVVVPSDVYSELFEEYREESSPRWNDNSQ